MKVTYNGDLAATVKNNPKSGYPCNGNKCISDDGKYFVMDEIEGGTVEYRFDFTATVATRPSPEIGSRMWLGAGQAAFTGDNRESPPVPSSPNVKTIVKATNAMTGKDIGVGATGNDGYKANGCVCAHARSKICVCVCVFCACVCARTHQVVPRFRAGMGLCTEVFCIS